MDTDLIQSNLSKSYMEMKSFKKYHFRRIAVLKSVKVHLKIAGCLPINQSFGCKYLSFIHIGFIFSILILNLVTTLWFYICEVHTLREFSEAVFWTSRAFLSLILYSMFIWNKSRFGKILDDLQEIVNDREFRFYAIFLCLINCLYITTI